MASDQGCRVQFPRFSPWTGWFIIDESAMLTFVPSPGVKKASPEEIVLRGPIAKCARKLLYQCTTLPHKGGWGLVAGD